MRSSEKLEEVHAFSPSRNTEELIQSKYFPTPHRVQENPEALHSFFHDNPVLILVFRWKNSTTIYLYLDRFPTNLPAKSSLSVTILF